MVVLVLLLAVLRWMEPYAEGGGAASSFPNKLEGRLLVLGVVVLLHWIDFGLSSSACCRGDREDRAAASLSLFVAEVRSELVHAMVCAGGATLTHGDTKPRPASAKAIHGGRHHSVLWSFNQRYFFLLYWRIFDLGRGDSDAVIPSGMFPGDGGDAPTSRSMAAGGEDEGPDCISYFRLEVLFVILEVSTVIFFFFEGLLVICKPHE